MTDVKARKDTKEILTQRLAAKKISLFDKQAVKKVADAQIAFQKAQSELAEMQNAKLTVQIEQIKQGITENEEELKKM